MKRFVFICLIYLVVVSSVLAQSKTYRISKIKVYNLNCPACAVGVEIALKKLKGVHRLEISLENEVITVQYNNKELSLDEILNTIKKTGYEAEEIKNQ